MKASERFQEVFPHASSKPVGKRKPARLLQQSSEDNLLEGVRIVNQTVAEVREESEQQYICPKQESRKQDNQLIYAAFLSFADAVQELLKSPIKFCFYRK